MVKEFQPLNLCQSLALGVGDAVSGGHQLVASAFQVLQEGVGAGKDLVVDD